MLKTDLPIGRLRVLPHLYRDILVVATYHPAYLLREPIPERGTKLDALLDRIEHEVLGHIMHLDHPRFFAYVPGPTNFVSVMADALATGFNVFAGSWLAASGAAEIELVAIDWLRELSGMPETAGGTFLSGGSVANLTALAVARHIRLRDAPEQARRPSAA